MNKCKIVNLHLVGMEYKFTMPQKDLISISIEDRIKINEATGKQIGVTVKRKLDFGANTCSYVEVTYLVMIGSEDDMNRESLEPIIRDGFSGLNAVFSKASLLISEITNACPLGIIITPPTYSKEVIIE